QRPSAPSGNGPGQASGSPDPGTADTGAALRAAGESCSAEKSEDTGLDAVEPNSGKSSEQNQQKGSCPPATSGAETATPAAAGDTQAAAGDAHAVAMPAGGTQE